MNSATKKLTNSMKLLIEVTQVPISENPDLTEISKALIKIQEDVVNKYQKYD